MNPDGTISVLDHGFVRIVDVMGNDASIVQAARVSYGEGTRTPSDDRALIRYLMRHKHTTPFEMVEFKFHVKVPIFIARQWHRHRMASINEVSARYSVVKDEFYVPSEGDIRGQGKVNKQGSEGAVSDAHSVRTNMNTFMQEQFNLYDQFVNLEGVAREQARIVLPQSAYTDFYWKVNLHNLLHFLNLRLDSHAQQEIRVYAEALLELITPHVPIAIEAFEDYVRSAITFSRTEQLMLARMRRIITDTAVFHDIPMADGELREFRAKLETIYGA